MLPAFFIPISFELHGLLKVFTRQSDEMFGLEQGVYLETDFNAPLPPPSLKMIPVYKRFSHRLCPRLHLFNFFHFITLVSFISFFFFHVIAPFGLPLGMFAETANIITVYRLATKENELSFSVSVCRKQTGAYRFHFPL
jgi:hypothetical protein